MPDRAWLCLTAGRRIAAWLGWVAGKRDKPAAEQRMLPSRTSYLSRRVLPVLLLDNSISTAWSTATVPLTSSSTIISQHFLVLLEPVSGGTRLRLGL